MTQSTAAATDVGEFWTDLDGGTFEHMLSVALSQTAAAVVDTAVFSALAFVLLAPNPKPLEVVAQIAGLQLLAKLAGGSLWARALARTVQRVDA